MTGACHRPGDRDDEGYALLAVIGSMAVLTALLLAVLGYAVQAVTPARDDQDAKAALAAAQAGIDDFVSRLNIDENSWAEDILYTSGTGTRPMPGTAARQASYSYQLLGDAAETARSGLIRVRATGTSRGESRSLVAELRPKEFLSFVYYTDVEVVDPAIDRSATVNGQSSRDGRRITFVADPAQVERFCGMRYYQGRGTRGTATYTSGPSAPYYEVVVATRDRTAVTSAATVTFNCNNIQFANGDVIDGPLHSNDALQINGSTLFTSALTETSWPDTATPAPNPSRRWWGTGTPSRGTAERPGYLPTYAPELALPASNSELKARALEGDGCVYTGETRIRFEGERMRVLSPGTTTAAAGCYDTARPAEEQVVDVPQVVYVDSGIASCTGTGIGYPRADEAIIPGVTTAYDCRAGNAFVQGSVSGRVTVASANDIVVTDDLTTATGTVRTDVIGLVADNNVWVYHPLRALRDAEGNVTGYENLLTREETPYRIEAAILAVRHSFLVQNWGYGAKLSTSDDTALNVTGSIAQRYRGPVGTGSTSASGTGYLKNYKYDSRLRNLSPPFFLKPDAPPWTLTKVSEE